MAANEPSQVSYDLASFISLALYQVYETIDESVSAWEKRGYWIKADRYRMDWDWTRHIAAQLHKALLQEDWTGIAASVIKVGQRLSAVKLAERDRLGTPWVGSWEQLKKIPLPQEDRPQ